MIKITPFFLVTLLAGLISCSDASEKQKETEPAATKADSSMELKPANRFESVIFASQKDTICGMPLTAGVEDTMHVDGKIYGFCAPECKEEFSKQIAANKSK